MKKILTGGALSLILVSCSTISQTLNQPLTDTGSNPLDSKLHSRPSSTSTVTPQQSAPADESNFYVIGTRVEVSRDTPFYTSFPRFFKRTKLTAAAGTVATVEDYRGDYAQIQVETGEKGFIKTDALVLAAPKPSATSKTSSSLPLPDLINTPAPSLPESSIQESPTIVEKKTLSDIAAENSSPALTEEEIAERIRKRRAALLNETTTPAPSEIPSLPEPAAVGELIPDASGNAPKLETPSELE